jgi:hypothetical protein
MIKSVDEENMKNDGDDERDKLSGTAPAVRFRNLDAVLKHSTPS